MRRGGPPARGGPPEGQADLAHRGATDGERMDLAQLLCEMDIIEADVGRGHEPDDLLPGLRGQAPVAGVPAQGVKQAAGAPLAEARLQSPKLPHANRSALAPCAFVMRPAALSNPARGTSFPLIEKVSMGGHFYRTDREDSSI
jgi:hypothetical protein